MPKEKNEKAVRAQKLYQQGLKLIEIANELDVKEGTVRSWKKRYSWGKKESATQRKTQRNEKCNVAVKKKML